MNKMNKLPLTPLRGCVTTASLWAFYSLTSKDSKIKFFESNIKQLKVDNFAEVAEILYWIILAGWVDSAKTFEHAWLEELNSLQSDVPSVVDDPYEDPSKEIDFAKCKLEKATNRRVFAEKIMESALEATTDIQSENTLNKLKERYLMLKDYY